MPIIGKRAICSFKRTYAVLGPQTIHRGNIRYMGEYCLVFPNSADLLLFYCSLCRRSRHRLKMGSGKGTFAMHFLKTCSHTNVCVHVSHTNPESAPLRSHNASIATRLIEQIPTKLGCHCNFYPPTYVLTSTIRVFFLNSL